MTYFRKAARRPRQRTSVSIGSRPSYDSSSCICDLNDFTEGSV